MKKLLAPIFALAMLVLAGTEAKAQDIAYSSWTTYGVYVGSDTTFELSNFEDYDEGFYGPPASYRITNIGAFDMFVGRVDLSTATDQAAKWQVMDHLGERLSPGDSTLYPVYYSSQSHTRSKIYAQAADAAGATGTVAAIAVFAK